MSGGLPEINPEDGPVIDSPRIYHLPPHRVTPSADKLPCDSTGSRCPLASGLEDQPGHPAIRRRPRIAIIGAALVTQKPPG